VQTDVYIYIAKTRKNNNRRAAWKGHGLDMCGVCGCYVMLYLILSTLQYSASLGAHRPANELVLGLFICVVRGLLLFLTSIRIPFLSILPCPYRYFSVWVVRNIVFITPSRATNALSSYPAQVEQTRNTLGRPGTHRDSIRLFSRIVPCHILLIGVNSRRYSTSTGLHYIFFKRGCSQCFHAFGI
jgi:hypothetical protein